MGARERVSVGRGNVLGNGRARASRCAAVGARKRLSNGCPWDERTLALASANSHFKVVEWAVANGAPVASDFDEDSDEDSDETLGP